MRDLRLRKVELLGIYSNPDNVSRLSSILAGQGRDRPSARPVRSVRQQQRRLTADEVERLIQRYRSGIPINDLAAEFGIARTTVMKHVERAGEPRRRNIVRDHLDEARQLYEQGWSLAKVADHYGINASTVGYTFRKAGVPRRDTQGR